MAVALRTNDRPPDVPADLQPVGGKRPLDLYLRDLWDRRDFIVAVPLGQLRAQNQNTVFGSFWHLLNPVLLAAVYYLVFGIILPGGRLGYDNYAGYLITGIFAFNYLNKGMMAGTRTVTSNVALIQQIHFPRAALPLSAVIVETIAQGTAVLALFGLVWFAGTPPMLSWLLLIPVMAIQSVFLLGACLIVARATFHFRDVEQLLPYILRLWMYLSGLFFALDFVRQAALDAGVTWLVTVFEWNPAWIFMSLWRQAMLGNIGPSEAVTRIDPATGMEVADRIIATAPGWYWGAAIGWSVGLLVFGFLWFRANESEYSRGA